MSMPAAQIDQLFAEVRDRALQGRMIIDDHVFDDWRQRKAELARTRAVAASEPSVAESADDGHADWSQLKWAGLAMAGVMVFFAFVAMIAN